jgi:ABC-2 type transport system permease protein
MFYVLFGVMNRGQISHGELIAKHMLAGYASFGVVGAALFGIGVGLALERTSGWLELKRASPMPPLAYLFGRSVMAVVFGLIITNVLCGLGTLAAGVHLTLAEYLKLNAFAALGAIPFAGMGLLLAMLLPPNAAPGIVNMIYLPMSFCSGLWMPLYLMPKWLQHLAPFLPAYHLVQLMLHAVGYAPLGDSVSGHTLALAGFTCVFLGCAWIAFSRMEGDA